MRPISSEEKETLKAVFRLVDESFAEMFLQGATKYGDEFVGAASLRLLNFAVAGMKATGALYEKIEQQLKGSFDNDIVKVIVEENENGDVTIAVKVRPLDAIIDSIHVTRKEKEGEANEA